MEIFQVEESQRFPLMDCTALKKFHTPINTFSPISAIIGLISS